MTAAVQEQEEQMAEFGAGKPNINPSDYSCQILQEKTTLEAANDKSLPNDARLIYYIVDGVQHIDLTRCKKTVQLFDMYYDKYGPGAVQRLNLDLEQSTPNCGDIKNQTTRKRNE